MLYRCLRHLRLSFCLIFFTVLTVAWAQSFQEYADDIDRRLEQTLVLYEQGDIDQAKRTVQMAYFEVFENLEGPIRINYSAQKSYEMEAAFGDIRKMIAANEPYPAVKTKVEWLKNQIDTVLPKLESGHQLTAEGPQNTYSEEGGIDPAWHDAYRRIDDLLNQAIAAYRDSGGKSAVKLVQQAQYEGFKNSNMETAIRTHNQAKAAAEINALFSELMDLGNADNQLTAFAYKVTLLLQLGESALQGVPAPQIQAQTQMPEAQTGKDWAPVANKVNQAILAAIERYNNGDKDAAILDVQDTYFDIFEGEGMEAAVGVYSSQSKAELESYFTQLVGQMQAGHDASQLRQTYTQMQLEFERTVQAMGSNYGSWFLFISSLLIILREGMEALLIVSAIAIYLIKSGHRNKISIIRSSVLWALAASVVTALLFNLLLANTAGAAREILEGITMLIAVVMLFGMSYWLLSKVESQHWQQYIQHKIDTSLTRGSLTGLWLTSFLAVYREGAETVLFYIALYGNAQGAQDNLMLAGGFAVGVLILVVVYFIVRYSMVRLPLKPFFIITGSFMYLMAFVFAGKGVSELIEGKLFIPTLIGDGSLKLTWLGIYPYWETLLPQFMLVLLALLALWVLFFRNRSGRHV